MPMTPDAKRQLSTTIRALRDRLLADLHAATEAAYRLSIPSARAGLSEAAGIKRTRLEAWVDEQVRTVPAKQQGKAPDRFLREVVKQAAYTLLNRLVLLRLLEANGLRNPAVLTGGWQSPGYAYFRALAPALVRGGAQSAVGDDTEGYAFLLKLVFDDLATELPGLYGPAGVADLVPLPAATLRAVVEALDEPGLASCWTDDMTLGWVYQYWNDPEREALDAKLNSGGKVEPHEIASKTQMFTERYMVDWLLQNSLGPMWLAMCQKHGWTPEVDAHGTLAELDRRRAEWRAKREAGEVDETALMPLHSDAEQRWAYYVPQPIPEDAVAKAPESVRALKVLDPACGSGHFLVVALDLLFALYQEEGRHREKTGVGITPQSKGHREVGTAARVSAPSQPSSTSPPLQPLHALHALHGSPTSSAVSALEAPPTHDPSLWSDRAIVESILENNLHGLDLDPRAVQIAAAALWLAARQRSRDARPGRLNLVASNLRLGALPDDDPALVELRRAVEAETGLPATLTDRIVHALKGADHLGSLLKVDAAVEDALRQQEAELRRPKQRGLFGEDDASPQSSQRSPSPLHALHALHGSLPDPAAAQTKDSVLSLLEAFLSQHSHGEDLGLRLRGEQLAAGVRFVRLVREGTFDLVVGNPPYQGTSKLADAAYVKKHYARGKADLFAAFLERGLQLAGDGGVSALLTMRNWMFIKQYRDLREWLLETFDLRALGDLSSGAFAEISAAQVVVSVVMSVFWRRAPGDAGSVAIKAFDDKTVLHVGETDRKRAAVLAQVGRFEFEPQALRAVPEWPLVYWWGREFLERYAAAPKLAEVSELRQGLATSDNIRRLRKPWEVQIDQLNLAVAEPRDVAFGQGSWVPHIMGAAGKVWFDPLDDLLNWAEWGLSLKVFHEQRYASYSKRIPAEDYYFRRGVAFATIGASFSARAHRYPGTIDTTGCSIYPDLPLSEIVCILNRKVARGVLSSLNPTIHFTNGDVLRLPVFREPRHAEIVARCAEAFGRDESHREPSVEFIQPGPSPWRYAQDWAQRAVDRPEGAPLPPYEPEVDPEPPTDHVSFALGVALGRFASPPRPPSPSREMGEKSGVKNNILDPDQDDLSAALPAGILFLDGTLDADDLRDGLGHDAAAFLRELWTHHGPQIDPKSDLRTYLAKKFFGDVHRQMYENRPIHWPLSSDKKTFVAWINIHRWTGDTLRLLLADHLYPTLTRLDGELADVNAARFGDDAKAARAAEKRFSSVQKAREELQAFIENVEQCAEKGPPPTDPKPEKCPPRQVDARYIPDLDDGVMINSAALWPLLEPQWKDPKKWWKELAAADGRKDYDWSHLAMRYWPTRVDAKCQEDPSLGVAHGCFWRYHPARAWAWELRLQDEIGGDFRIEEQPYPLDDSDPGDVGHRAAYLAASPEEALEAVEKEVLRRRRKAKAAQPELTLLEAGLWRAAPELVWALELRVGEKQGVELFVRAPDEAEARAAFEAAHSEKVTARRQMVVGWRAAELFEDEGEDEEGDGEGDEDGSDDDR